MSTPENRPLRRNGPWARKTRHALLASVMGLACAMAGAQPVQASVKLYVLDCGRAEFKDFAAASDTGEWDARPAELADPCFLVRHPKGWLLWDAGLPPDVAALTHTDGADAFEKWGMRLIPGAPLAGQLALLGLRPADVRYIAFSHLHFDHVGNASLFGGATWILDRSELAWATASPAHVSMMPALIGAREAARTQMIDGDHDVFGDGSVRILKAPGHTPGSGVLLLRLAKAGAVILSGDLYLTMEGRAKRQVPTVNADRADTLASMQRVEAIAQRLQARVIVQHDPKEFASLPKLPDALE